MSYVKKLYIYRYTFYNLKNQNGNQKVIARRVTRNQSNQK